MLGGRSVGGATTSMADRDDEGLEPQGGEPRPETSPRALLPLIEALPLCELSGAVTHAGIRVDCRFGQITQ